MRVIVLSALLLSATTEASFSQTTTSQSELNAAAQRIRASKIERYMKWCKSLQPDNDSCEKSLEAMQKREQQAVSKIMPYAAMAKVNEQQFGREVAQCRNGYNSFEHYVICLEHFVARVADAERGDFIFRR